MARPFWQRKTLAQMTTAEWESLCDGCGKCCLVKLEDEDTGEVFFTDLACELLDGSSCRCGDYPNRQQRVTDCVQLTPDTVASVNWLPSTCAYRLLAEGQPLAWWHPLVSGDPNTVFEAGIAVRGKVQPETGVPDDELVEHIVHWVD